MGASTTLFFKDIIHYSFTQTADTRYQLRRVYIVHYCKQWHNTTEYVVDKTTGKLLFQARDNLRVRHSAILRVIGGPILYVILSNAKNLALGRRGMSVGCDEGNFSFPEESFFTMRRL